MLRPAETATESEIADKEWLNFNQELTRKTSESLVDWLNRYDKEEVSAEIALTAISTMIDITSGLIDRKFQPVLWAAHKSIQDDINAKRGV